ncbi:MAG: PAS domain-containing protein [Planctomycetota bacterium]|nr:PAS domain-containing protein [Planctomycetota bacterium]
MAFHLPAQDDFVDLNEPMKQSTLLKSAATWLYLMLGGLLTTFIWYGLTPVPELMPGGILTGLVWIVVMIGIASRAQARRLSVELDAAKAFEQSITTHRGRGVEGDPETSSATRLRHVPAWLVFVMGLTGVALIWEFNRFEFWLGESATLIVGASIASMLALAVAANTLNRRKAKRLDNEFRIHRDSEQATLDTLRSLDVMFSVCLPTGERTEFNNRFLEFVGRPFEELKGNGWLEIVSPGDRQQVLDAVRRPLGPNEKRRTLEYGLQHRHGHELRVRETLTPRTDDKGHLIEYIGAIVDVTEQVQLAMAQEESIASMRENLAKAKDELSKTKTSRNRFQKNLDESRADVKHLTELVEHSKAKIAEAENTAKKSVEKVENAIQGRLNKLQGELKTVRTEHKSAQSENRKLTSAFETMKTEIAEFRKQEGELRDQIAMNIQDLREANADAADARNKEAQQRAKTNDFARQRDELESKLSSKSDHDVTLQTELERALAQRDQQLNDARAHIEGLGMEMAEQSTRIDREVSPTRLADQLRRQLDGLSKMNETLGEASLQGPHRDALHNTTAAIRIMQGLVDQALGLDLDEVKIKKNTGSSFDMRQTLGGVHEFLEDDAKRHGVNLEIDVAANVPGLVYGDDIALREAMMSLTRSALALIKEGTLKVKLTEDLSTDAHTTLRCEFTNASARVKAEHVESMMALNSTDQELPNAIKHPIQHQAAQAWRIIRHLDGSHGFMMPDQGGFTVWCTFNVGRVGAAAGLQVAALPETSIAPPVQETPMVAPPDPRPSPMATTPLQPVANPIVSPPRLNTDLSNMPRLPQEFLDCNLGKVIELGVSGVRVHASRKPKTETLTITIDTLELEAKVEWTKKLSGRKHDVGLAFVNLSADQQKKILAIAMSHRRITTLLDRD